MTKKKTYEIEEIDELRRWFSTQSLPESMQIDSGTYSPDLSDTLSMLFDQAYLCYANPRMQGCIYLLERIKKNLEEKQG